MINEEIELTISIKMELLKTAVVTEKEVLTNEN